MAFQIKLPRELIVHLNSYTSQAGINRPLLVAELVSDFLSVGLDVSSEAVLAKAKLWQVGADPKAERRMVRLGSISKENQEKLRAWATSLSMNVSDVIEIIIRDRFSDEQRLRTIVERAKASGYQSQLAIPEIDTSEQNRIGIVALLSPQLRAAIEQIEKVESRNTTQQIEHFLSEAVEKQNEYDSPLSKAPQQWTERKLVRVDRQIHAKLMAWSQNKKRNIQNQVVHILHKAVEKLSGSSNSPGQG
jgi:hypothetical protein